MGKTTVASNLIKKSVFIDKNGNQYKTIDDLRYRRNPIQHVVEDVKSMEKLKEIENTEKQK